MNSPREMVIVPCMCRTGASLIGRVLCSLGYSTGNRETREDSEAKEGIYWNAKLTEFHDAMLKEAGATLSVPRPIADAWWTEARISRGVQQLSILLADKFGANEKFFILDSRISRLMPLWKAYFAGQNFRYRWILPLERRAGISQEPKKLPAMNADYETLLWVQYVLESERHTRGMDRLLILRSSGVNALVAESIAQFLGVSRESTEISSPEVAELGSHESATHALRTEPASDLVNRVWEELLQLKVGGSASHASLDALWSEFTSAQGVVSPAFPGPGTGETNWLSDPSPKPLHVTKNVDEHEQEWDIVQLLEKLQEVEMGNAEAWRRNDALENECNSLKMAVLAERKRLATMEESFSWWVTTPARELNRMQARFRRSIAKRLAMIRKVARKLSGSPETAPSTIVAPPTASDASNRDLIKRIPVFSNETAQNKQGNTTARAAGKGPVSEFAIYFNSSGNYFFQEIALLLHGAFTEAGFRSVLRTDEFGRSADAAFHLIVAPHEFFALGKGSTCFDKSMKGNLFFLNTEQPQTQWFGLAKAMLPHARHIFDMDRQTADTIRSLGYSASHLPLGYVHDFKPYSADADLLVGPETESLGSETRRWRGIGRPLRERPIDLSFVGEAAPRRSAFFAKAASILDKYECHLRLMPRDSGVFTARGTQIHRRTLTTVGLSQRSKIFLNVHRDEKHYFEWHRIVLMGIWQRALVITETAPESPPFVAGRDYIQATLEEMPELIEYYLRDPKGIDEAEDIRNSGYDRLRLSCNLPGLLKKAWSPFLAEIR